jgi:hypothetical protein
MCSIKSSLLECLLQILSSCLPEVSAAAAAPAPNPHTSLSRDLHAQSCFPNTYSGIQSEIHQIPWASPACPCSYPCNRVCQQGKEEHWMDDEQR